MGRPAPARPPDGGTRQNAARNNSRVDPRTGDNGRLSADALRVLQPAAGNQAVVQLVAGALPRLPSVQRLRLDDGPPVAPGHYRYGSTIVGLDPKDMRDVLTGVAVARGLPGERRWQETFVVDMRGEPNPHQFEDGTQSVHVEQKLAANAVQGQEALEKEARDTQDKFQQELLGKVRSLLDTSEKQVQAEARRYGFPDDRSVLEPQPLTAGQSAALLGLPEAAELKKLAVAAKDLLDGKRKLNKARKDVAGMGAFSDAFRPAMLEPVLRDYHQLRTAKCGEFPVLAAAERDAQKLAELASSAQLTRPESGQAANSQGLLAIREWLRKGLTTPLVNIAYVRAGMTEPDKVERFWLDSSLRAMVTRSLSIQSGTFAEIAVRAKVDQLQEDREFTAKLKAIIGMALLALSFVPGVNVVAGVAAAGIAAGDVLDAFQEYFWEEAASGTALDKAEAISQSDPSLFGLGMALAFGLLEGVAEVKALQGAIEVFKALRGIYREARAASLAVKASSGAAKSAAAADLLVAETNLRTVAESVSGKPGLGDRILASLPADEKLFAQQLDEAIAQLKNSELRQLVRESRQVDPLGRTLQDRVVTDQAGLERDFGEWQRTGSKGPFEEWLWRDQKVWVNTKSGVFHGEDSPFYGATKNGKYMTRGEATAAGYRAAKSSNLAAARLGTAEHARMTAELREFEGLKLDNGWELRKVERTVGGTKRIDQLWVNDAEMKVAVTDYFTGAVEPAAHFQKGVNYQFEAEIKALIAKGYTYEYHPVVMPGGKSGIRK